MDIIVNDKSMYICEDITRIIDRNVHGMHLKDVLDEYNDKIKVYLHNPLYMYHPCVYIIHLHIISVRYKYNRLKHRESFNKWYDDNIISPNVTGCDNDFYHTTLAKHMDYSYRLDEDEYDYDLQLAYYEYAIKEHGRDSMRFTII